jgi:hypothetical protein
MKTKTFLAMVMVASITLLFLFGQLASAEKKMPDTVTIKSEGAKMAPVTLSHETHAQKHKIDCAVCHHKDQNPKEPQPCVVCHLAKEVKANAPIAKDAFHKQCQTCHKEQAAKGVKAPTKCMECHKKAGEGPQ